MCLTAGVRHIFVFYLIITIFPAESKTYYFHVNKTSNEFVIYNRANLNNSFHSYKYPSIYMSELRNNISRYKNNTSGVHTHPFLDPEWDYNWKNVTRPQLPSYIYKLYEMVSDDMTGSVRILFNTMPQNSTFINFNMSNVNLTEIIDVEMHFYHSVEEDLFQKSLILRLYQIETNYFNDTSLINPDAHKLLNVIYVRQAENGWQIFKLTNTIQDWLKIGKNLTLLITISKPNEEQFSLFKETNKDMFRTFVVFKSDSFREYNSQRGEITVFNSNPCQKHDLHIDFEKLNWMKFIISPTGYNAFNCYGRCYRSNYLPNHIKVTSFIPEISRKSLCCVPIDYSPLPIMFYDNNGDIAINIYERMIVSTCGCR